MAKHSQCLHVTCPAHSFWCWGTIWDALSRLATRRAIFWSPQWTSWSSHCFPGRQRRVCQCFRYAQDCSSVCSNGSFSQSLSICEMIHEQEGVWHCRTCTGWFLFRHELAFFAFNEIILDLFPTMNMTSGFGMFDSKLQERGGRNDSANFKHVDSNILRSCLTAR